MKYKQEVAAWLFGETAPRKMNKAVKREWLKDLRSKGIKQTRGHLNIVKVGSNMDDYGVGMCCLGRLCKLAPADVKGVVSTHQLFDGTIYEVLLGKHTIPAEYFPPESVLEWASLNDFVANRLAGLNDNGGNDFKVRNLLPAGKNPWGGFTFKQIADFVEVYL